MNATSYVRCEKCGHLKSTIFACEYCQQEDADVWAVGIIAAVVVLFIILALLIGSL